MAFSTVHRIKAIEVKGEKGNNKGKTGLGRRNLDYNHTKPNYEIRIQSAEP
jgi:hypothetical protein